jgi:hypothetical protein
MNDDTFIYFITFFVFIMTVFFLLIEYVFKKWKCNEGKCQKVILGDYTTMKECLESKECNKTFENNVENTAETRKPIQQTLTGYDCVNQKCTGNYKGTHGYTNENECMKECGNKTPITVVNTIPNYSYGYPYSSLYPYGTNYGYPYGTNYGYGRMWSPRRRSHNRWSPQHHGRSHRRLRGRD